MTRRTALALCCVGLFSLPAYASDEAQAPACCAKKTDEMLRCSLTGKEVEKCCCVEREGKLHCTLADKDVETCCCTSAQDDSKSTK